MSVILDEHAYQLLRNNDPSYQVMTRVSDANNVYDVRQEYIKTGETRNDFATQLELWKENKGVLNDGRYVDLSNFFNNSVVSSDGNGVVVEQVPYFKFKTNAVLNYHTIIPPPDTFIKKQQKESVFDASGDRVVKTVEYNSNPLQRCDKLVQNEMDSLFVYVNGIKIPDIEVYVYASKSFTDVFIPEKYVGDIRKPSSLVDTVIHMDFRQAGSEQFYERLAITNSTFEIDLTEAKHRFKRSASKEITKDKIVIFADGLIHKATDISREGDILTITVPQNLVHKTVELYILGDIVHRHHHDEKYLNNTGSRVHFYLNDNYFADILSGPITKSAVSFYYKGMRVDDTKIVQTSRFSFEYIVDTEEYNQVEVDDTSIPIANTIYYTKDTSNNYVSLGRITQFEPDLLYFTKDISAKFDEEAIDFFIEDVGVKVDELGYKTYGDDYYLLNLLGVKRCVDMMKGTPTWSVFDDPAFNIGFKKVLSNDGELFDVQKAIDKYTHIAYNTPNSTQRAKELIKSRPTLLRRFLEQIKNPTKRFVIMGNEEDVTISSVYPLSDPEQLTYYKIYLNHLILDSKYYTVTREANKDFITISKDALLPLVQLPNGKGYSSGVNEVEVFQFDMTYREKTIFYDNVLTGGFDTLIDPHGQRYYRKTYNLADLPFEVGLVADDICAIEKVSKGWFDSRHDEFFYVYPGPEGYGWRPTKMFRVVEKTDNHLTIEIALHVYDELKTGGNFYLLAKQYNVSESIRFTNVDGTYMEENDLLIPVYSSYSHYKINDEGKKVFDYEDNYIPYINNSEPIISKNDRELIFGKDYTFTNPETNKQLTTSYVIFKTQPGHNDEIRIQFNSTKTNILLVGYDDLNIENRYGLLYLSELPYPVSTEYMNIYINGEKVSEYDVDILSDKLIRVHHITRPIRSVLITTNSQYKDSEILDYIDLYKETEFEKLLGQIFWNCDPSKIIDSNKPNVNYIYKVDPYYSEFVGELEHKYDNPFYKEYVSYIIENGHLFDGTSSFSLSVPEKENIPDEDVAAHHEARLNAEKFFNVYKSNHGLIPTVDSVLQEQNPFEENATNIFITDTLEIMYLNWLAASGKTRTYGFKGDNIDRHVLAYFSIFENVILNNRIDIVIDSGRYYDGLRPDVNNPPYIYDRDTQTFKVVYPGISAAERRRMFFEMLLQAIEAQDEDTPRYNPQTGEQPLVRVMCDNRLSNILYPEDFPFVPDAKGIIRTGTDVDICNYTVPDHKNVLLQNAIAAERAMRERIAGGN